MERKDEILQRVREINLTCKENIKAPNCLDKNSCWGDCCYASNEIPRCLMDYYVKHDLARKVDFEVSDTLCYRIKIDHEIKRCIFFDPEKNCCKIHSTNMKPPQCCVYPLNFNLDVNDQRCRKGFSFNIENEIFQLLKKKMDAYMDLAQEEYSHYFSKLVLLQRVKQGLAENFQNIKPSEILGLLDDVDSIHPLISRNPQPYLLELCEEAPCDHFYYECNQICNRVKKRLLNILEGVLPKYIEENCTSSEYYFRGLLRNS